MSSKRQKHDAGYDTIDDGVNGFAQPNGQSGRSASPPRNNLNFRQQLIARRATHQGELERLDEEIVALQNLREERAQDIADLTQQIAALDKRVVAGRSVNTVRNYYDKFEWSGRLKEQMRRVFGIEEFRLAQEGVCNANMDGRDIICIMPTGGGKSLTYQLPATLMPGCTLVISPLISLMRDQILHLQENRIEALMFTGSMSYAEMKEGYDRLIATARNKDPNPTEVKLCYVTPERVAKSKKFMSIMKTMVDAEKLARIVVDEAHCVSTQGHDYRPDYKELTQLRVLYPAVPILALSATCPPDVLRDVLKILRLPPTTGGIAAAPYGTVKFTSPLYRKNLHYKIVLKPSVSAQLVREMMNYILECYPNDTGIVYCLTRADSERIATDLSEMSEGKIKTGVYHAEIKDKDKDALHEKWRLGEVKVMCATIAFGLGIDKKDVRFVMHHSVSKSVETFYQESGRAGRDGKDADCILYYRLQDALRIPGALNDRDWERRINGMIEFCLDYRGCRKLVFANYFSSSDWAEDRMPCGHCDNCIRDPESVIERDVTSEANRMLAVTRALREAGHNVTTAQLAKAARGSGKLYRSLQLPRGDNVKLSPLDTEVLVAHMLLENYLEKLYTSSQYKVNVYVQPGVLARRLDEGQKLVIQFLLPERGSRDRQTKEGGKKRKAGPHPRLSNGSAATCGSEEDDDSDVIYLDGEVAEDGFGQESAPGPSSKRRRSGYRSEGVLIRLDDSDAGMANHATADNDSEYESEDSEWKGNLRGAPAITHRTLRNSPRKAPFPSGSGTNTLGNGDNEVIEIFSE